MLLAGNAVIANKHTEFSFMLTRVITALVVNLVNNLSWINFKNASPSF